MYDDKMTISVRTLAILADTLQAAMHDIQEHLQVARYNLTGEFCGGFVEKPAYPLCIHPDGIAASEEVIARCQKHWELIQALLEQLRQERP